MAKAVWKIDKNGKRTYVGHVPDGYQLKDGERFGLPKEDGVEVVRDIKNENSGRMLWL